MQTVLFHSVDKCTQPFFGLSIILRSCQAEDPLISVVGDKMLCKPPEGFIVVRNDIVKILVMSRIQRDNKLARTFQNSICFADYILIVNIVSVIDKAVKAVGKSQPVYIGLAQLLRMHGRLKIVYRRQNKNINITGKALLDDAANHLRGIFTAALGSDNAKCHSLFHSSSPHKTFFYYNIL